MAGLAIYRELLCLVIRIRHLVIVCRVAAEAGVRCVVVVPVVAGSAIIGYDSMCAIQHIIIIVNGKAGRRPIGLRRMTGSTVRREAQRHVVRIGTLVEIRRMASRTIRGCALVTAAMTVYTTRRQVYPCQREVGGIMVKNIVRIARRMAGQACRAVVGIAVDAIVFIVRFRVGMTGRASKLRIVGQVDMAIHTLVPLPVMRPAVNREELAVVVESSRHPG